MDCRVHGSQRVGHDRVTLPLPFTRGNVRFTPGVRSRVRGAGSPLTVQTRQAVVWQPSGRWGRLLGWGESRAGSRQTQGSTGAAAVRTVCPGEQPPRASPPAPRRPRSPPSSLPPSPPPLPSQSPESCELGVQTVSWEHGPRAVCRQIHTSSLLS